MTQLTFNQSKMEAFMEQMVTMLNGGALSLMTSIGHRTGLFDTMRQLPPATSHQIASAAGLQERYVREWLAAMVTGRIVEYNPANATYCLPQEHAALLTRAATPNNMATTTQYIAILGAVEDRITEAFRQGGGVSYAHFERFHAVMAEESNQLVVMALKEYILPIVPGLIERLEAGIDVLDLGCGHGRALQRLAAIFPNSHFTGYDLTPEVITTARQMVAEQGLTNIQFSVKDATHLDEIARYDLIFTFDAIHDQAQPATVLRHIYHALRPNGTYLMQDIAGSSYVQNNLEHPFAPLLYTISSMHCMTVSLAQGGDGLGTMWGKELALQMLNTAGFAHVEVHQLPHDPLDYYYVMSKA